VSAAHEAIPAILHTLERHAAAITELRTHTPTLEDVFVSLTGRHLRDE
jgi:ABC-2 type transport system ATP-binding protein